MRHVRCYAPVALALVLSCSGIVRGEVVNHARAWATDNYGTSPPHTVDVSGALEASASANDTAGDLSRGRQASAAARLVPDPSVKGNVLELGAATKVFSQVPYNSETAGAKAYWYDTLTVTPHPGQQQPTQVMLTLELEGSMKVLNAMYGGSLARVFFNNDVGATVQLAGTNPASNPVFTGSWKSQEYTLVSNPQDPSLSMTFRGTLERMVDVSSGPATVDIRLESESSCYILSSVYKEANSLFGDTLTIKKITNPDGSWPTTWDYKFDSGMVPEPATFVQLAGLALLGLVGYLRRQRR